MDTGTHLLPVTKSLKLGQCWNASVLPQCSVFAVSCPSLSGKFSNMLSSQQNSINNLSRYKVIPNTKLPASNHQSHKPSAHPGVPGGLEMTETRLLLCFFILYDKNTPKSSLEPQIPCLVLVELWVLPPVPKVKTNQKNKLAPSISHAILTHSITPPPIEKWFVFPIFETKAACDCSWLRSWRSLQVCWLRARCKEAFKTSPAPAPIRPQTHSSLSESFLSSVNSNHSLWWQKAQLLV